jgi:hypothetical protein
MMKKVIKVNTLAIGDIINKFKINLSELKKCLKVIEATIWKLSL